MHVADRRHGLDVVASLRADGVTDPDVLLAGLLHDAGKGDTGRLAAGRLLARARRTAPWVWRVGARRARVRAPRSSGCATTPRPRPPRGGGRLLGRGPSS